MKFVSNTLKNMDNNFIVFILTHGRPNNVKTYTTLRKYGYTGKIYFILDNEDKTIDQYKEKYGSEFVMVFNKKEMADTIDEGNNFDDRRCPVHARNASFKMAKDLGVEHFLLLEDDYYYFGYRYDTGAKKINNLDVVFTKMLDFYKSVNIKSIAFGQGGDHIGGFSGIKLKRKCMNSFFCSTYRPFSFVGVLNDDVNTYTTLGNKGEVFFTFTNIQLDQADTQVQSSGMTDFYLKFGTYCKAFTTTMMHPSGVKVSMMNSNNPRIHHSINWKATTPMIVSEKHKK
jgi:hypothetical protein